MSIGVKICGLKTHQAVDTAIDAGASHFGLVFFRKSPRNIALARAAKLANASRGRIQSVALVVNSSNEQIDNIAVHVRPDMFQLHGSETPERASEIRSRTGLPVIKAISVGEKGDTDRAEAYRDAADLILFDAKPPREDGQGLPGGNGNLFDWQLLAPVKGKMQFMLSGGLTPDNVADAIRQTGAALVDVSSGVESAPGKKDPALIRRFIDAARSAVLEEINHE